jgi:hypothetical protein
MSAAAGGAAAAAAAARMNATIAAGGMIRVDPEEFLRMVDRLAEPVIVHYRGIWAMFMSPAHHYIMPYKGLTVVTKSRDLLFLPKGVELIEAKSLYMPI